VPRGKVAEKRPLKIAVLSVLTLSGALPLLWQVGTPKNGDIDLAKPLWEAAVTLWGTGACQTLLVDAGFLDGAWMATLHRQGTTVITRVREGMAPFTAVLAYVAAHPEHPWHPARIPQRPTGKKSLWRCPAIITSMICPPGAWESPARVHAILFSDTLRWLCRQQARQEQAGAGGKPWRRRTPALIVYAGGAFAVLKPSVVLGIILAHAEVWVTRRDEILAAVRYCEGSD